MTARQRSSRQKQNVERVPLENSVMLEVLLDHKPPVKHVLLVITVELALCKIPVLLAINAP